MSEEFLTIQRWLKETRRHPVNPSPQPKRGLQHLPSPIRNRS